MTFRFCQRELIFPRPALVMGIVNVTPDSFSDGGQFLDTDRAVAHGLKLVSEGAEILDIGGESTRPGAQPVSESEELRRVLPVIEALAAQVKVPLSIDTMKPAVAQAALKAGASIVNDVAANRGLNPLTPTLSPSEGAREKNETQNPLAPSLSPKGERMSEGRVRGDDAMWRVVSETGAGYVCMHMQGTPQTMQKNPVYEDVRREVADFFRERLGRLAQCGVAPEQVILDVGIGFGKTLEHNLQLLGGLSGFTKLGQPLLVGVSRKSFIGKILGDPKAERLPASLACATLAVEAGAQIIRAHDVAETVQAVRMTEAIMNHSNK